MHNATLFYKNMVKKEKNCQKMLHYAMMCVIIESNIGIVMKGCFKNV